MNAETHASGAAVPRQTVAEILARIEAAIAAAPPDAKLVIASDADNTLWDGDVGDDIYAALLAVKGVREPARAALAAEARAFGLPSGGDGNAVAAALLEGFESGRYPSDRNYAMVAWAFAGWHVDELRAFCLRVVEERRLAARARPELRAVKRWADERHIPFCIVSASPLAMATAGVAILGIPAERVAAMTPAVGPDGVILPRLEGPVVYGEGKMRAFERLCPDATLVAAFGDGSYDAALLRASRIPVAVTPSKALVELFPTIPGVVQLAR